MPAGQQTDNSRTFALTVSGVTVTGYVPADSIYISETGSDSIATMECVIEFPTGDAAGGFGWINYDHEIVLKDNVNNRRLFGGNLVGTRLVHMAGPGIAAEIRVVSFDAWLDRRNLPRWKSVTNVGGVVRKISSDRAIIQRIIAQGAGWLTTANSTVAETSTDMPVLEFEDGSLRSFIQSVAEAAATVADPTPRRCYVDFDGAVHYFKGNESSSAPYRIGDANYTATVKATSGLVAFWPMGEASGATAYDAMSVANATLTGSYTRDVAGGLPNEPQARATTFGSTTTRAAASGAALTPATADVFSLELWFKRSATVGTNQTLIRADGTGGFELRFTNTNTVSLRKVGTGSIYETTPTYTDTNWHHLVVTKSGATRAIYVDGAAVTASGVNATIVDTDATVYIGYTSGSFVGSLRHVAIYSEALPAATVLAHYNDGRTVVPDYIDYEYDMNSGGHEVYIRGGTAAGTGWIGGGQSAYRQNFIIDRPESRTAAQREAIGKAFLRRDGNNTEGGRFIVTGYDGWRAGQTVAIDDAGLGVTDSYEIRQIDARMNAGAGVLTYEVSYGALPWSGTFDVVRKRRGRSRGVTGYA